MSRLFHKLPIREITHETDDCISIAWDIPHDATPWHYTAGQYLTLRAQIDGEEVRRSYSLCSMPSEREMRVAIKRMPMGKFSNWAPDTLEEGMDIDVMLPAGSFSLRDLSAVTRIVFIAAGSGITPIYSMLKHALAHSSAECVLVYGNRSSPSIIFKRGLEDLKDQYMGRLRIMHILSREKTDIPLFNGRITGDKFSAVHDKLIDPMPVDDYYICGPNEMIDPIVDSLTSRGVTADRIHHERFSSPLDHLKKEITPEVDHYAGDSEVQMILDGEEMSFPLNYDGKSILDAALEQGADLPYACKGGVCSTCKAHLSAGSVHMTVHWGLEPDEIQRGYILSCQAHPTSKKLIVNFDK